MNARIITSTLLLAGLLLSGHAQVSSAEPSAKSSSAKPKMVPRPVPGLSKSTTAAPARSPRQATATSSTQAAASAAPDKVRILMIYRRGTFSLPPADPALTAASNAAAPVKPQPAPATELRPGQVRILTQAEAEILAAQSRP